MSNGEWTALIFVAVIFLVAVLEHFIAAQRTRIIMQDVQPALDEYCDNLQQAPTLAQSLDTYFDEDSDESALPEARGKREL